MIKKPDMATIKKYPAIAVRWLQRYAFVSLTVVTGLLMALAISSIKAALTTPMDQLTYDKELITIESTNFDQDTIQQIVDLTSRDVDIRAQFAQDRNNPFLGN